MERINKLLEARRDNRDNKEIRRAAQNTVNEVVSAVFTDLPDVNILGAQGYTPHFNDGDICEWRFEASIDWVGVDDLYYSPISSDSVQYSELFTREIPHWTEYKSIPEYDNLLTAQALFITLSKEFEILDESNGTWWLFIRDPNEENGFRIESGTFDHD